MLVLDGYGQRRPALLALQSPTLQARFALPIPRPRGQRLSALALHSIQ